MIQSSTQLQKKSDLGSILLKAALTTLILKQLVLFSPLYGTLAGGRPNAFSGGINAFAGVVNPANAVWIADRFDIGCYLVHQKSSLENKNNNPLFLPGKSNLAYRSNYLLSADAAIQKHFSLKIGEKLYDSSWTLAAYTLPSQVKLRTRKPMPISGTTPIFLSNRTSVISGVFSLKLSESHSVGISLDYFFMTHRREGYQNSDTPQRSVSPGHVTNNGVDHSGGVGLSLGWRWKITSKLDFGAAWSKKSACGQFRKYRGYEPDHAKNYIPQLVGAGFSYRFTPKLSGRLELVWSNSGNLPNANNNILSNGELNTNKRGSKKSPGSGLSDATYINCGLGYQWSAMLAFGAGFSRRIKIDQTKNFISHTYTHQIIYNVLTLGANFNYQKHNLFFSYAYGFENKISGLMPIRLGGGKFTSERQTTSLSLSYGYLY